MTEKAGSIRVFVNPKLVDLLPAYLKRREADVELLLRFIEVQDFDSIRTVGHKLSGNGSLFGFDRISELGTHLEVAATGKDLLKIQEHTQALTDYLANIEICAQADA